MTNSVCRKLRFFDIVLVLTIFILGTANAKVSVPSATSEFYVNDFANIFSEEEKSKMLEDALALADNYDGIQVVVSTVKSLNGNTVEEYALSMYNQYEIGKDDMGALILLATEDRQIRIELGRMMESYINDSEAGRLIDEYAIPYLRENNFSKGLIILQEALINHIIDEVYVPTEVVSAPNGNTMDEGNVILNSSQADTQLEISNSKNENAATKSGDNLGLVGWGIIFVFLAGCVTIIYKTSLKQIKKKEKELERTLKEIEAENNATIARFKAENDELSRVNNAIEELYFSSNSRYEEAERKISDLENQCEKLYNDNDKHIKNQKALETELSLLRERFERASKLHPNLEAEIMNMINEEIKEKDMAEARVVDDVIMAVLAKEVSKDIYEELRSAVRAYETLTDAQKSYVAADISRLKENCNLSRKLLDEYKAYLLEEENKRLACTAQDEMLAVIEDVGVMPTSRDVQRLKRARVAFENLGDGPKKYFDFAILKSLDNLLDIAIREFEREEEERRIREAEERRRQEEEERRRREERRRQEEEERKRREERRRREEEERRRREDEERRRREARRRQEQAEAARKRQISTSRSRSSSGLGGKSRGGGASRGF